MVNDEWNSSEIKPMQGELIFVYSLLHETERAEYLYARWEVGLYQDGSVKIFDRDNVEIAKLSWTDVNCWRNCHPGPVPKRFYNNQKEGRDK